MLRAKLNFCNDGFKCVFNVLVYRNEKYQVYQVYPLRIEIFVRSLKAGDDYNLKSSEIEFAYGHF